LVAGACGGGDGGGGGAADGDGGGGEASAGGGDAGGDDASGGGGDLIVGTTDTVNTLDPAKCYSYYCSNIFQNAGNTLVSFAPGESEPSPQLAAEMPEISEDGLTYTFALRDDVTFHDGSQMTSEDVAFSLNRARWINHPEGAGFLLSGIEQIDTPDDTTVEITLAGADITFVSKLAYTVATILPSDGYPSPEGPTEEGADPEEFIQEEFIGTGPYTIGAFQENQSITLETFEEFYGDAPANDRVLVQFFEGAAQLKAALEAGDVTVAFRGLTPEQRADLDGNDQLQTVEGEGASIRYIVLNTLMEPFDDPEVRKAMAAAVDRQRIVDDVLAGDAEPLYTMVPPGFGDASTPAFEELYADSDPGDFVDEPVEVDLWYATGHYGDTEPSIAQSLERSLEESGAFDVTLESTEWAQFTEQAWPADNGQYPAFLLGWYPDYLDPDDYLYPFYESEQSFLQMYSNDEMDQLIGQEQTADAPDAEERTETFQQIQQLAAEEAPIIPLYVETPFVHAQSGVTGLEETMDTAQIFRYYLISPGDQ
jgi:peptide/nickel transport system substrate-binding protein